MEISNPRRILFVGPPDSGVLSLLKDLTGSTPPPLTGDSTAGLSHTWKIKTNYYTAQVPIWVDEIIDVDAWRTEFTKPEAKEVVGALGAWVVCFRKPVKEDHVKDITRALSAVQRIIEKACGYSWDGVCLAVAMPQSTTPYLDKPFEEWDDLCREYDFEYVDSETTGKNEFGEPTGVARLRESLEANDWEGVGSADVDELEEGLFSEDFSAEEAEMGIEFLGLKVAVNGGDAVDDGTAAQDESSKSNEAAQVEELERMMGRLQTIKDTGAGMSESERRKFAAKEINKIMQSL